MMTTTERPLSAEASSAFRAWQDAVHNRGAALLQDPYGATSVVDAAETNENEAWDKWCDYASAEGRCEQCATDLDAADPRWPFAYCRRHMDSVMVREYDAGL